MKKGLLIVAIFIGSLLSTGRADDVVRNSIEDKFRMALIEEETGQQLDTAIQAYKEVIAGLDDQRKMAVTAIYHLGECYRKQGKTNDALAQFERILRDFSEQKPVVDLAQRRCAELSPGGSGKGTMQVSGLAAETGAATVEETDEIQRLKSVVKDSPDLINAMDQDGRTPLLKAAASGYLAVVKYLIANGADINAKDRSLGRNALHWAAGSGHKSVVEFLLSQGVDVNSRDRYGATPLLLAVDKGFKSIVQVLLDNKADVNVPGRAIQRIDKDNNATILGPLNTPLDNSIANGNFDITKLLLANKANPNVTNDSGQTTIFIAISKTLSDKDRKDKAIDIVELLLQNKADIHYKCESAISSINGTPLHLAVQCSTKATELLISHGADVNATNGFGDTPLHMAVNRYNDSGDDGKAMIKDNIELLLAHGAGINVQNNYGDTPLHDAVIKNEISTAELLLNHKADVNIVNRDGETPLQLAKEFLVIPPPPGPTPQPTQQKGNPKMEELLRKYGANDTPKKAE